MNFDKDLYTGVIFIDLKKAFDTVDHDILIAKLSHYGVAGKELDWFKSYMSNRKQCCKVNGAYKSNLSIGHRETHKSSDFALISQWCCRILVT